MSVPVEGTANCTDKWTNVQRRTYEQWLSFSSLIDLALETCERHGIGPNGVSKEQIAELEIIAMPRARSMTVPAHEFSLLLNSPPEWGKTCRWLGEMIVWTDSTGC
jgi:hypothetical protein